MQMTYRMLAATAAVALVSGCTSAEYERGSLHAVMTDYRVTLYSGGKAVREWKTKGKVSSEEKSDGYFFVDRATGKLVEISGDVVIEQE